MQSLSIDFETRATVDLRKSGVYPYAAHRDTGIWCMAWAFDEEEPVVWAPHSGILKGYYTEVPRRIRDHVAAGGEMRAWNAAFERIIWREIMVPRYDAPEVRDEQWVCSAAEAAAMALPRSLDQCARVIDRGQHKDQDGYALMMRMTRPREVLEDGSIVWWDEEGCNILAARKGWTAKKLAREIDEVRDRFSRLCSYCSQDVRTEKSIVPALRRLTPHERDVYLLDQRMNDHGIRVDLELVEAAKEVADETIARANATLGEITAGEVTEVTNSRRLAAWITGQGVETNSVAKAAVAELLSSDLDPKVREALELRADAGRSSIAKLDSMLCVVGVDDRARGLLLYHGASTGRWSGRLIQPQNFPRGEVDDVEAFIPDVLARRYEHIDLIAHPVVVISSMLRSMLTAAPGKMLVAADYSAIEAVVLNWLADQRDMVENFRSYFAGDKTRDPYVQNAMRLYSIPFEQVKKFPHRQTGKFQELGCGYGMGVKKAMSAAKSVYGLDIDQAQSDVIVKSYRETHNRVVDFWYRANDACIDATLAPGAIQTFGGLGNLRAVKLGAYLYIVLPSGRPLCYASPKVVMEPPPWGGEERASLHYWGVDPLSKQWGELRLYGGLIVENIVQAVSRDLMADGLLRAEANGYTPLLSVHDEVITEVPEEFGNVKEFERLLSELPQWAAGCPVAAEGWKGFRYRK